ncbi:hypothetical protein ACIP79_38485 [Streptomyces sp. NPDC088747]|uniref:hypothetical protein n=1 Tax=Streptomyces sp. NPDC088747 TaxID=3365886 RepID=UPI00382D0B1F
MSDAIDAVDWGAIPGHPDWYEPARASRSLRSQADAANPVEAAEASPLLDSGGIVHGHSAAVFPAAAVAAPLLLDITQHGHPAARNAALELVDEAPSSYPHDEYTRMTTSYGPAVPICCAIAHQPRAPAAFLVELGKQSKALLAHTTKHWCFEIRECVADSNDTAASGALPGCFPGGVHAVELHDGGETAVLDDAALKYPPTDGSSQACSQVTGRHPGELPPGAALFPAECGERLH